MLNVLTCISHHCREKSKASGRLWPQKTALSSQTGDNNQIQVEQSNLIQKKIYTVRRPASARSGTNPCKELMANTSVRAMTCHFQDFKTHASQLVGSKSLCFRRCNLLFLLNREQKETKQKKNNKTRAYQTGGNSFDLPQHAWKEQARSFWMRPRVKSRISCKQPGSFANIWKILELYMVICGICENVTDSG